MTKAGHYFFGCACDYLVRVVKDAAEVEWLPYRGYTDDEVSRQLQVVMRQARRLKLWVDEPLVESVNVSVESPVGVTGGRE